MRKASDITIEEMSKDAEMRRMYLKDALIEAAEHNFSLAAEMMEHYVTATIVSMRGEYP